MALFKGYRIWMRVEIERSDYSTDQHETLDMSESIDTEIFKTKRDVERRFKTIVNELEEKSHAAWARENSK